MIAFERVSLRLGSFSLKDVSLSINRGDYYFIIGPSGAGKTVLLEAIAGLHRPDSGRILLRGKEITDLPPERRGIGLVYQDYSLFPNMTVIDNVSYGLRVRGVRRQEGRERVAGLLERFGVEHLADRYPGTLSGGEQQRVALARAIAVKPDILLLDEPLSNLDALLREQMRLEIKRIQKSLGITTIYVTHDRVEAMSLSDRIIVMKNGFVRQIGSPDRIYEDPDSKFVAGFVGKVAFLPVEITAVDGRCSVRFEDRVFEVGKFSPELKPGDRGVIMARPESLKLLEPGAGMIEGRVNTNIYLGGSLESFVSTDRGEILVQIDNPAEKKVFAEGEGVSIGIIPNLVKALPDRDD